MSLRSLFFPLLFVIPGLIFAQDNIINNSLLNKPTMVENLWGGVDSHNYLTGFRNVRRGVWDDGGLPLLQENGTVDSGADNLPVSVNFVDLNGDGLPDLVMGDVAGYYRVYFNSGTKTEPKFTTSEILSLFLSRDLTGWRDQSEYLRMAPRINLYDWQHRGLQDLVVGNYKGEIFFIPNSGSKNVPDFHQPPGLETAIVKTTKKGDLWANLLAPYAYDWDGDGKVDLLAGEGSYSANAIHLLLNKGTNQAPKFSEDARYYLAYGDGREQLVPTLADYFGDGKLALLVGDRTGRVAVYKYPDNRWTPGSPELKFSTFIKFGTLESLGGPITICAADYNGDGLFDLIIGDKRGHVSVAVNKGTKEQPLFDKPVLLTGVYPGQPNIYVPPRGAHVTHVGTRESYDSGWSLESGFRKGNINGYFTVVSGKDEPAFKLPPDHRFFKAGYFPSLNKILPPAAIFQVGWPEKRLPEIFGMGDFGWPRAYDVGPDGFVSQTNAYYARYLLKDNELKSDTNYILTFKVRGADCKDVQWSMSYYGYTKADTKEAHGERGEVKVVYAGRKTDLGEERGVISPTPTDWTTTTCKFRVHFKERELRDPKKLDVIMGAFDIHFTLKPYTGVFYLDDVQLVPEVVK